ncbi:Fam135a, partial [Symbiodinium sp. KB8]
ATTPSARGRRPHLVESVRLYKSPGSRRQEHSEGRTSPKPQAAQAQDLEQGDGVSSEESNKGMRRVRVQPGQPKILNACGGCRLELPEHLAASLASEVKKQVLDMADLVINPLGAGPFQLARTLEERRSKQLEDLDRVDRLWEFRLCEEMLRDCLDGYARHGERDMLSTAEEVLMTAEELLRRITELAILHEQSDEAFLDSIGRRGKSGTFTADVDGGLLVQALRSPDFREKGGLTRCLISSRLLVSGLLESVVGELTCWRSHPSESDLQAWRRWDKTYERLASRVAAVQQAENAKRAVPTADPMARWRCLEAQQCDAADVQITECFAGRTAACAPMCGYGQTAPSCTVEVETETKIESRDKVNCDSGNVGGSMAPSGRLKEEPRDAGRVAGHMPSGEDYMMPPSWPFLVVFLGGAFALLVAGNFIFPGEKKCKMARSTSALPVVLLALAALFVAPAFVPSPAPRAAPEAGAEINNDFGTSLYALGLAPMADHKQSNNPERPSKPPEPSSWPQNVHGDSVYAHWASAAAVTAGALLPVLTAQPAMAEDYMMPPSWPFLVVFLGGAFALLVAGNFIFPGEKK